MTRSVAIVIPTLNEQGHIGPLLEQLGRTSHEHVIDILIADGGSVDETRTIVRQAARRDRRIRLIDNPDRLQAAGINRAVRFADARADTIVRIDAHAGYPDTYVDDILAAFASSGAQMVATRLHTTGDTCLQRGIAAAMNSRLGTGGSAHRVGGLPGFVDHGHHAGMDRALFERVSGYDERFAANEDAELDHRIRLAGGRIWLASDIEVDYRPRATWRGLFIQYWRYGRGRAQTTLKHRMRLRARQLVPPAVTVLLGVSFVGALADWRLLAVPASYLFTLSIAASVLAIRSKCWCALFAAPAAAVIHVAWGAGFIASLLARPLNDGTGVHVLQEQPAATPIGMSQG